MAAKWTAGRRSVRNLLGSADAWLWREHLKRERKRRLRARRGINSVDRWTIPGHSKNGGWFKQRASNDPSFSASH